MQNYLLIGVGAFLGANLRYAVQTWAAGRFGASFPYGTLIANVSGSFLLGLFVTLATQRAAISPAWRLFFAVGFVGGYTTFSSFTVETLGLAQGGNWLWGAFNVLSSVLLGLTAAFLGAVVARLF